NVIKKKKILYLVETGKILLNGNEEEIRLCVESDVSKRLIESFVSSEETTIVLQKRTISEESKSAEGGSSSSNLNAGANGNANANANKNVKYAYDVLGEIPEESFDAKKGLNADMVVYVKLHGEPLSEGSISSQVIVNQLNSQSPLGYMLPYIRHSFVPTAVRLAQLEEQKQRGGIGGAAGGANANVGSGSSRNTSGRSGQVLDKLRELEMKLIESQDESLLSGVTLDPVKGVQEFIDLCSEEQKSNIVSALEKSWETLKALSNGNNNNIDEIEQKKANVLKSLCEDRVLNEIQNCLKQWKEQIQTVLRRSGTSGLSTVRKQIRFWEGKKAAIVELEKQLQSPGVQASLHVLKLNKSIFWITTFQTLGVEDAQKEVDLHYGVLSAFPLQNVISSTSVQDLTKATTEIFKYLDTQKIRTHYTVEKIAQLGRDSGRDIAEKLLEILSKDVMFIKYSDFETKTQGTDRLFREFQHKYSKVQTEMRQQRLRQRQHAAWNLREEDSELIGLEKRVEAIKKIRESHNELEKVIDPSFSSSDKQLLEEAKNKVIEAYEIFRTQDVLRCLDSQWKQCVDTYNKQLRSMIRSKMEQASDPREMFRVCEKFNKLF
ncbi:cytoplasmic dynein, partial [Reticulomyxa filosa]